MTKTLEQVVSAAAAALRGEYAKNVVAGVQRWSGADLKGKAARFGGQYARQRAKAAAALRAAGGEIVAARRGGRLSTAVAVAVDDFGVAIYATTEFGIVPATELR